MTQTINGAYTSAQIFTTNNQKTAIDQYAISQLQMICDQKSSDGCRIRVIPDVHPGKVGTIGLTMTIGKTIVPNLVGIDIGCGMTLAHIKGNRIPETRYRNQREHSIWLSHQSESSPIRGRF